MELTSAGIGKATNSVDSISEIVEAVDETAAGTKAEVVVVVKAEAEEEAEEETKQ